MASKWKGLPDIDTAPDVYESGDPPPPPPAAATAAATTSTTTTSTTTAIASGRAERASALGPAAAAHDPNVSSAHLSLARAARAFRSARFDTSHADFSGSLVRPALSRAQKSHPRSAHPHRPTISARSGGPHAARPSPSSKTAQASSSVLTFSPTTATAATTTQDALVRLRSELDALSREGVAGKQEQDVALLYAQLARAEQRLRARLSKNQEYSSSPRLRSRPSSSHPKSGHNTTSPEPLAEEEPDSAPALFDHDRSPDTPPEWTHRTRHLLDKAKAATTCPPSPLIPPAETSLVPIRQAVVHREVSQVEAQLVALERFVGLTPGSYGLVQVLQPCMLNGSGSAMGTSSSGYPVGAGPSSDAGPPVLSAGVNAGLVPALHKIQHQIILLSQPRHRDAVGRRIKVLTTELERVQDLLARRRAASPHIGTGIGAGGDATKARGGAGGLHPPAAGGNRKESVADAGEEGRQQPKLSLSLSAQEQGDHPTAVQVARLWRIQVALEPVFPIMLELVRRMRALARLHDQSQEFGSRWGSILSQAESLRVAQENTGWTISELALRVAQVGSEPGEGGRGHHPEGVEQVDEKAKEKEKESEKMWHRLALLDQHLCDLSDQVTLARRAVFRSSRHTKEDSAVHGEHGHLNVHRPNGDEVVYE